MQCQASISLLERTCVVATVAAHENKMAMLLHCPDDLSLTVGRHACKDSDVIHSLVPELWLALLKSIQHVLCACQGVFRSEFWDCILRDWSHHHATILSCSHGPTGTVTIFSRFEQQRWAIRRCNATRLG